MREVVISRLAAAAAAAVAVAAAAAAAAAAGRGRTSGLAGLMGVVALLRLTAGACT